MVLVLSIVHQRLNSWNSVLHLTTVILTYNVLRPFYVFWKLDSYLVVLSLRRGIVVVVLFDTPFLSVFDEVFPRVGGQNPATEKTQLVTLQDCQ